MVPVSSPSLRLDSYDGVLFDLDGVITPTAEVHMRAWTVLFDDVLRERGITEPYTDADYFAHVDGKPRYDGVRDFLASRRIELPEGSPQDASDAQSVAGLGNRKNDVFASILRTDGVQAYPGSLRLLEQLAVAGTSVAVVSSSRNARAVLEAADIVERFDVVVDGTVAAEHGLPGKPAPDTFWHAARQLGVADERCAVIEDAVSGVVAGRAGGFALVVGVDRGAGAAALQYAGADVVVGDLAELMP